MTKRQNLAGLSWAWQLKRALQMPALDQFARGDVFYPRPEKISEPPDSLWRIARGFALDHLANERKNICLFLLRVAE